MRGLITKFFLPTAIFLSAFFVPTFDVTFDLPTLLTIVSLIFAILVGFFIATATTNYLRLQSLIVEEDAALISMFHLCKIVQPRAIPKLRRAIDNYVLNSLDYNLDEYIEHTWDEFDHLIKVIQEIRPSSELGMELYDDMHVKRDSILRTRQETICVAPRIVSSLHWSILISLAGLVIFLLFALRDGELLVAAIAGLLSVSVYMVLWLLYQIDSNIFLEEILGYHSSQRVFNTIGTKNYYPEHAIHKSKLKLPNQPYRVGSWKQVNHRMVRNIRIVNPIKSR